MSSRQYLLSYEDARRLRSMVGANVTPGLDHIGNMYVFKGPTKLALEEYPNTQLDQLFVYTITGNTTQTYAIPSRFVLVDAYDIDGEIFKVHHIARRIDSDGNPEIVFMNGEINGLIALLPVQNTVGDILGPHLSA